MNDSVQPFRRANRMANRPIYRVFVGSVAGEFTGIVSLRCEIATDRTRSLQTNGIDDGAANSTGTTENEDRLTRHCHGFADTRATGGTCCPETDWKTL